MTKSLDIDVTYLGETATEIRRIAIALIYGAGSGHPGGCLSAADILAALYFQEMQTRPDEPDWEERDRFVLSKGHACPALYAALYLRGYFPHSLLSSFRRLGGELQGEPHIHGIPGVDATSGSLGQGFSVAIGMALGLRHKGSTARVYVMLGDGELQEGEVWEGAMCASHYGLDNLCGIVDYNKMQSDDLNSNIMRLEPLQDKWESFNWHVIQIDGHDFREIIDAFAIAKTVHEKPTMIIAHTIKGKGVSYMEGVPSWHGSVKLKNSEFTQALLNLGVSESDQGRYLFHE